MENGKTTFRYKSPETRLKMRLAKLGKKLAPFTAETKLKMSLAHKGKPSGSSGRHWKMAEEYCVRLRGKNNSMWKGEKASYGVKHVWVHRNYGKASKCENPKCVYPRKVSNSGVMIKPTRYHWANISRKYYRVRSDWMQLCPSCHWYYDNAGLIIKVS